MAIWKDNTAPRPNPAPAPTPQEPKSMDTTYKPEPVAAPASSASSYEAQRTRSESLIASDITIEGKIEGAGHVRIAGRFKGDVHVQGDVTIEVGARVNGAVRARRVVIGGELEGNIDAASRVELLESGVLNGNLKAGSLTVAAGSRMRGQVEFGWEDRVLPKTELRVESATA